MAHNRKLVFSGVALVKGSLQHNAMRVPLRKELERLMIESGYLERAPFVWVGLIFRYGLVNETVPHYQRINKKYGDLPLAIELDMRVLMEADEHDPELLKEYFEIAALDSLIHAGRKYKLNTTGLEARRAELGRIPSWDEIQAIS
ncbi:MAG: immunity protein 39 [Alphaproteobacteria bacterium]|nr:immunity protein 39 [Alphaproteobacteria bacterium]